MRNEKLESLFQDCLLSFESITTVQNDTNDEDVRFLIAVDGHEDMTFEVSLRDFLTYTDCKVCVRPLDCRGHIDLPEDAWTDVELLPSMGNGFALCHIIENYVLPLINDEIQIIA